MARVSREGTWNVEHGNFASLCLDAEVFFARCGLRVEARNIGAIVGRQGSTLLSCLWLLRFAPVRMLPKRARIDVTQGDGAVTVHAHFEDSFRLPVLGRLVTSRYQRQFSEWLQQLEGHVAVQARLEDSLVSRRSLGKVGARNQRAGLPLAVETNEVPVTSLTEKSNGTTPHENGDVLISGQDSSILARPLENIEDDSFDLGAPLEEPEASESPTLPQASGGQEFTEALKTAEEPTAEWAGTASTAADEPADELGASHGASLQSRETEEPSGQASQSDLPQDAEPSERESFQAEELPKDETAQEEIDSPALSAKQDEETVETRGDIRPWLGLGFSRFRFSNRLRSTEASPTVGLPPEVGLELTQGDALLEAGALTDSIQHYDAALAAVGRKPEAGTADSATVAQIYLRRGMAYFRQNHAHVEAARQLEKSVRDFQAASDSTRNKVIADYDEAIRLSPSLTDAYYRRGEAHLFTARCERGSRRFRQASQELSLAVTDFSRATELNPSFATAFALRAVAHSLLDHEGEAEADVGRAVALGADSVMVWRAIWASKSWNPKA